MFADDTTIYIANKCTKVLFQEANREVANLNNWFNANKLSLNIQKTKYILFRTKKMKFNDELSLSIGKEIITRDNHTVFLGMHLDRYLTWDEHVNHVYKKLSSALYMLRSAKYLLSYHNLRLLYHALFEPYLNYGVLLWSNTTRKNINMLFKMQKKAIRIINKAKYNDHTNILFKKSKIVKLNDKISMSYNEFMYKFTKNYLPFGIQNIFRTNSQIHQYETRQSNYPHMIKHTTSIYNNSFMNKAPILYQNVHMSLKSKATVTAFRRGLKKHYIDSY